MAGLKDRSDLAVEGLTTLVAFVDADPGTLALKHADSLDTTAVRADGTIRPYARFDVRACRKFIVEVFCVQYGVSHGIDFFNEINHIRYVGTSSIRSTASI